MSGITGRKLTSSGQEDGAGSRPVLRVAWRLLPCVVLVLVLIALSAGPALASQGFWQTLSSGTAEDLRSVFFVDQNTGWAVGNNGVILSTSNGGLSWQAQTSGSAASLLSVVFVDSSNGWAVGSTSDSKPVILHTSDGGKTWVVQASPAPAGLASITAVDANTAWACGGSTGIVHTTDGGATWVKQDSGLVVSSTITFNSIKFVDKKIGFVAGTYHSVRVTTDGGLTWLDGADVNTLGEKWGIYGVDSMSFTDKDNGWLIGDASIIGSNPLQIVHFLLHTINGARSWQKVPVGSTGIPLAVQFVNQNEGWIIGAAGLILHTGDGGATWVVQSSGTSSGLNAVSLPDTTHGSAVGQGGTIVKYRVGSGPPPPPGGNPIFIDVPATATYFTAIQGLGQAGVIDGYPVGSNKEFRPANNLTRAQFAKMILGVLQVPVTEADWLDSSKPFTDFGPDVANNLYPHDYVAVAFHIGIVQGKSATTFEPTKNITRLQLISIVARAGRLFAGDALPDPPATWTGQLAAAFYNDPNHGANLRVAEYNGLLAGLSAFGATWDATAVATRGEAAQILWNLFNAVGTLPPAPGKRILFADDFSSTVGHWAVFGDQTSAVGYDTTLQHYVISINQAPLSAWGARSPNYADFTVEVDAQIANPLDGLYGLVFRLSDNSNYYEFALSKDGKCQLWKRVAGVRQELTSALDAGSVVNPTGFNHLRVTCQGSTITMYVNGTKMGVPVTDTSFTSGKIGLIGEATSSGGVQFWFDNFKLWSAP